MIGSKFLTGALLISGSAPSGSTTTEVSRSRKMLVAESKKKFHNRQKEKARRKRRLRGRLRVEIEFGSARSNGGTVAGKVSKSPHISSYDGERKRAKSLTYSLEEQQKTRDKVFKQRADEIVEKYKRKGNVWWSPDRELNEFKVGNDAVELLIETTFTESEKSEVKNRLREYWCSSSEGPHGGATREFRPKLFDATYSMWDIFGKRNYFYYWWLDYCNGRQPRYPNWSDRTWPGVSIEHSMRGLLVA